MSAMIWRGLERFSEMTTDRLHDQWTKVEGVNLKVFEDVTYGWSPDRHDLLRLRGKSCGHLPLSTSRFSILLGDEWRRADEMVK